MGIYSEYLNTLTDFQSITAERKRHLRRISEIRQRCILTIASDMSGRPDKGNAPVGIDYTDRLAVADQLDVLSGDAVDVVLETPGGLAERAEDMVHMLRGKFESVAFIVPGAAMSAGTIMVMSGDEILLEPASSLGPIDAQVPATGGKRFSAEAFLKGLDKIKQEVEELGTLNRAYIPILQGISPGEIQTCENALYFAQDLVTEWLAKWKFQTWQTHSSTGKPVTEEEKGERAGQIAKELCNHSRWLTHGKSIRLGDLVEMGLKVTNYTENHDLAEAIRRYYTLLRMTFESTSIYKLFETPDTQIQRFLSPPAPAPARAAAADVAHIDFECPRCSAKTRIQANLGRKRPLQEGSIPFPRDNTFKCPNCGLESDLGDLRKRLEAQSGKRIVV